MVLRYLSAYVLPPPLLVVLPLAAWILPNPCDLCGVHFGESSLKVPALRTPTWHGVLVMMTVLMMRRMTGMRMAMMMAVLVLFFIREVFPMFFRAGPLVFEAFQRCDQLKDLFVSVVTSHISLVLYFPCFLDSLALGKLAGPFQPCDYENDGHGIPPNHHFNGKLKYATINITAGHSRFSVKPSWNTEIIFSFDGPIGSASSLGMALGLAASALPPMSGLGNRAIVWALSTVAACQYSYPCVCIIA